MCLKNEHIVIHSPSLYLFLKDHMQNAFTVLGPNFENMSSLVVLTELSVEDFNLENSEILGSHRWKIIMTMVNNSV